MKASSVMKLGAWIVWALTGFYLIGAIAVGYRNYTPSVVSGDLSLMAVSLGTMPTVIPGVFAGFLLAGLGSHFAHRSSPPTGPG